MADRPRKPSDDPLLWYGIEGADELGRILYDVLALVMCELEQSHDRNRGLSFDEFRAVLYRHLDEQANQANSKTLTKVIDSQVLKAEMEVFLALAGC